MQRHLIAAAVVSLAVGTAQSLAFAADATANDSAGSIGAALAGAAAEPQAAAKDGRSGDRGYLGIVVDAPREGSGPGVSVGQVAADSPAAKAGLKAGDRIVAIGSDAVGNLQDLAPRVEKAKAGTKLSVKIVRDGKEQTLEVEVARRPRPRHVLPEDFIGELPSFPEGLRPGELPRIMGFHRVRLGVETQRVTKELADSHKLPAAEGALVGDVVKGSPAEKAGVKSGDCIVEAGGKAVKAPEDLQRAVREAEPGKEIALKVYRDGKPIELTATLESHSDMTWPFDGGVAPRPPVVPRIFAAPKETRDRIERLESRVNALEKELQDLRKGTEERPALPPPPKPPAKPGGGI